MLPRRAPHANVRRALAWALGLWLAGLGNATEALAANDRVHVRRDEQGTELVWEDTEERLHGLALPGLPKPGDTLSLRVDVQPFNGPPLEGPLQVSLREPSGTSVERLGARGERGWDFSFPLQETGPHVLTFSWRSTQHKVVHAELYVGTAPVETVWKVGGVALLAMLAVWSWLRRGHRKN